MRDDALLALIFTQGLLKCYINPYPPKSCGNAIQRKKQDS